MTVYFKLNNARDMKRDLSQGFGLGATAPTLRASVMSLLPWRQQDMRIDRAQHANPQSRILVAWKVIEYLSPDTDDLTARLEGIKGFAAFCVRTVSEQKMDSVQKAVRSCLNDLEGRRK